MANKYCDPSATGANDGTSWSNAYTSPQALFDSLVAGDNGYIGNSDGSDTITLTAGIDVDTNAGAYNNYIKIIAVNSSGTADGTQVTIDANSTATNCILATNKSYYFWKNFTFENATVDGVRSTGISGSWIFISCQFNNCGGDGFDKGGGLKNSQFFDCQFAGNTGYGAQLDNAILKFCVIKNNGNNGVYCQFTKIINSIVHNNTLDGIKMVSDENSVMGCICDGNGGDGIAAGGYGSTAIGNRCTNNTGYGIDYSWPGTYANYNAYYNNTAGETNNEPICCEGNDVTLTSDGYADRASDDFTITGTEGINIAYSFLDGVNESRIDMGITPVSYDSHGTIDLVTGAPTLSRPSGDCVSSTSGSPRYLIKQRILKYINDNFATDGEFTVGTTTGYFDFGQGMLNTSYGVWGEFVPEAFSLIQRENETVQYDGVIQVNFYNKARTAGLNMFLLDEAGDQFINALENKYMTTASTNGYSIRMFSAETIGVSDNPANKQITVSIPFEAWEN